MLCSCPRLSCKQQSLLLRCQQEITQKVRIDLILIRAEMNCSLSQTDLLSVFDYCNVACRSFARKDQIVGLGYSPASPLFICIFRNAIHAIED